jgi:hypothetical protein
MTDLSNRCSRSGWRNRRASPPDRARHGGRPDEDHQRNGEARNQAWQRLGHKRLANDGPLPSPMALTASTSPRSTSRSATPETWPEQGMPEIDKDTIAGAAPIDVLTMRRLRRMTGTGRTMNGNERRPFTITPTTRLTQRFPRLDAAGRGAHENEARRQADGEAD